MASYNGSSRRGREAPDGVRARLQDPKTRFVTVGLLAAVAVLVLLLGYWIVLLTELPSTTDLQQKRFEQATVVYTADGQELTSYQDKNRRWVSLDEVSPHVVDALLAAEDHRFYRHWGIDVRRTIGSILQTLTGDVQGGSTLTMQLARNAFPDIYDDMALTRKVKEWVTALRLEGMYTKDEILEMYLNTVPFMYNAFGIEAAAQTYYQISASELNVKGSATLVGLLKGTVYYNPVRHPDRSHERRNVVLRQMVEHGYLDEAEYQEIKEVPTVLNFKRLTRAGSLAPHFADYLRQWLDEWAEQHQHNLYTDGLRVYTTIDSRLQQTAEAALSNAAEGLQAVADVEWSRSSPGYFSTDADAYRRYRRNVAAFDYFWRTHPELLDRFIRQTRRYESLVSSGVSGAAALDRLREDAAFVDSVQTAQQRLQAGFVAVDPQSGHVLAWVGGRDFGADQFDHVASARRQPGSTFKPFVYAAALENGFSPNTRLRDEVREYVVDPNTGKRWRPTNVGSSSGQLVTLKDALAYSKNTVTAQLVQRLGPHRVVDMAHRMGIQSPLDAVPSIGLGTSEVSLLEMAGAYTTIANNGRHQEPVFVTRIEDPNGRVLARFTSESRQVLNEVTAYDLLRMMQGVVEYGTGQRIRHAYGAPVGLAGKTGTTQNGADGWFMLLHPRLVMGAWVGFDVPAISFRTNYWGQGAHTALPIVGRFFRTARREAPEVLDGSTFRPPPGYRPPRPAVDTTRYASYQESAYLDSLDAVSDSILSLYEDSTWRYDEWTSGDDWDDGAWEDDWEMRDDEDSLATEVPVEAPEPGDLRADSLDLRAPLETGDDDLSPADSLNRRERQDANRRIRKRWVDPEAPPPREAAPPNSNRRREAREDAARQNTDREEDGVLEEGPGRREQGRSQEAPPERDQERAPVPPPPATQPAPTDTTDAGRGMPG